MKIKFLLIIVCLMVGCKSHKENDKLEENYIAIEKSDYGLIFTTIEVNGKKVKAMVDFGDPNILQLSSRFVESQKIKVKKIDAIAKDMAGNTFEINEGTVEEVIIGKWKETNLKFQSSPNEMESVSKQINTEFNAVIGWGYFSQYYTTIDYKENRFELSKKSTSKGIIQFSTNYNKNSNYLSIPITINNSKENFILDTGSPLTMIDSSFFNKNNLKNATFKIGDTFETIKPHVQNLGMLKQLNAIGIIGGDYMIKYKINIDPFKKQLNFVK